MIQAVYCSDCEELLGADHQGSNAPLCPHCGSKFRTFAVTLSATTTTNAHVSGVAGSALGEKAFFESERHDGASAFATLDAFYVTFGAAGSGSHGEGDTRATCERLVRVLNSDGGKWSPPANGIGDVDCVSEDSATGQRLQMQVVRALVDPEFWKSLSRNGSSERTATLTEAADLLFDAIQKKAAIPARQRPELALVLDANRTSAFAFQDVVEKFEHRHGAAVRSLGFASIYVVGPVDSLVKLLA
jgi:hypothetical protein